MDKIENVNVRGQGIFDNYEQLTALELIRKVLEKINEIVSETNTYTDIVKELRTWFDRLDVSDEVKLKLDEMESNGTLANLINVQIFGELNNKLDNVDKNIKGITLDVRDFGAVGDGVTDDTIAFQTAIDYCIANNKQLFIPKGNPHYVISDTLNVNGAIIITSPRAILEFTGSGEKNLMVISSTNYSTAYTRFNDNPVIEGVVFRSKGKAQTRKGLLIYRSAFINIKGCYFTGFEKGIEIGSKVMGTTDYGNIMNIQNCGLNGNKYGITLYDESNIVNIDECWIVNNTVCGVVVNNSFTINIRKCLIADNGEDINRGNEYGAGIVVEGGGAITIDGNYFEKNGGFVYGKSSTILFGKTTYTSNKGKVLSSASIINNTLAPSGHDTLIRITNGNNVNIEGNRFHPFNACKWDIDLSEMTTTDDIYVKGNGTSSGRIKLPNHKISTAKIEHGMYKFPNEKYTIKAITNYSNLITNGGFENDLTDWTNFVDDNPITVKTTEVYEGNKALHCLSTESANSVATRSIPTVIGHKYFFGARYKHISTTYRGYISADATTGTAYCTGEPGIWLPVSTILTATKESTTIFIGSVNKSVECYFDNIVFVDLTELFGANNEPTNAWCERNLMFE